MTRSTRIYGKVALLMAGILAASVLLTLAVGVDRRPAGKTRIVASFYPVYIAALNLADGVEGGGGGQPDRPHHRLPARLSALPR